MKELNKILGQNITEAFRQDKRFEIEESGIKPETWDVYWKNFSMSSDIYFEKVEYS